MVPLFPRYKVLRVMQDFLSTVFEVIWGLQRVLGGSRYWVAVKDQGTQLELLPCGQTVNDGVS